MVIFDYVYLTHTTAVDISIDVARCFNSMIEACENLSCQQQGADLEYLKLMQPCNNSSIITSNMLKEFQPNITNTRNRIHGMELDKGPEMRVHAGLCKQIV